MSKKNYFTKNIVTIESIYLLSILLYILLLRGGGITLTYYTFMSCIIIGILSSVYFVLKDKATVSIINLFIVAVLFFSLMLTPM